MSCRSFSEDGWRDLRRLNCGTYHATGVTSTVALRAMVDRRDDNLVLLLLTRYNSRTHARDLLDIGPWILDFGQILGTWDHIPSLEEKETELLIGAHESIAGGVAKAVSRAEEDGCEVVQIFTGSPSRWSVPSVSEDSAREYRNAYGASSLRYTLVHGSYLINPASPDTALWERSLRAIVEEYKRCISIEADYLIMHPGSSRGSGREESVARVAKMIDHLFTQYESGPVVLIENTAGAGETLGGNFSEISGIVDRVASPERIGCCFDTAHAFAAGYDLRTPSAVSESLERVQFELGRVPIHALHLNDSAKPLSSGVDRHARIGEGLMGMEAFRSLVNRKEFAGLPAVLETQPLPEDEGRYRSQVELLKSLREGVR